MCEMWQNDSYSREKDQREREWASEGESETKENVSKKRKTQFRRASCFSRIVGKVIISRLEVLKHPTSQSLANLVLVSSSLFV